MKKNLLFLFFVLLAYTSSFGQTNTFPSSGNVGIGTTTPENAENWNKVLQVYGSANSKIITSSSSVHTGLWSHNSSVYGAPAGGLTGTATYHPFTLVTNRMARLVISAAGNVGIGTTNPDMKLTVKGKIHAEEVKVDLSVPAPDYVFEEDYELRTLEETEKYILENKHLPEIPSAKEMEANGVAIGEMNMKLLQKIEELTLHVIELNKQVIKLQEENKALEKKVSE